MSTGTFIQLEVVEDDLNTSVLKVAASYVDLA